ncbi:Growth_factor receptor cysteine-rich domain superfamily [Hexamita inflata]|uniref:Growth factor receptor cysteine-rich domain superfamily n=1 Tax=Hexamita inflata TaxID=28002 RepID=A0AA86U8T5_9EUKA|nr:Growth factor receptor cysteine-rich domain superfamily [Hexamita inflata]
MYVDIHVKIASLLVCVENMPSFGYSSFTATQTELETLLCANICKTQNQYITYGICQQQPQFSTLLSNQTVICEYPFIFNDQDNLCECDFGFYLNISFCVNVIDQFSITQKNATIMENEFRTEIKRTELELKTAFIGLEQLIINNITAFVKNMNDNDLVTNNNIISTNYTIHKNINDLRAENTNQFNTMTGQIENTHIQTISKINTEFNGLASLLNDNQVNIKNNFTTQKVAMDDFRANMITQFNNVDKHISDIQTENKADINDVKTKLDTQTTFINDNQMNIKNNFTAQKDYITDFRTNVQSTLNLMDSHITNFQNDNKADLSTINNTLKSKLDTQTALINDNQVNIKNNFIDQKDQITNLTTSINTRFTTLDSSSSNANMKLDALKTQLAGSQTSIESKINGVSTQIATTKTQLTDVQSYMTNTVSTQQYLKDVYNSLYSAVNAIAVAQDPCKQWPGSVNQNGLCRCSYMDGGFGISLFCPSVNKCCRSWGADTYKCPGITISSCDNERFYPNDVN